MYSGGMAGTPYLAPDRVQVEEINPILPERGQRDQRKAVESVQWQVQFLKHIHTVLDEEFQTVQDRILGQLVDKLKAAMSEVQKLEKRQGCTDPDPKATKDT
ncbi:hypothetical protein J4E91_007704 [Alternaria rosae]|nr:hypothetical protein J4E91_007704 [Alternaria rosae]